MTINLDDANLAEILKKIIADADLTVGDLFDDQDILDHVHDGGMPIDEIFAEDEILGCGCVIDAIEQERKDCEEETIEKYEEEIEELQKKVAELTEQMRFMDPNGVKCDRCDEPVLYEGNEGKISNVDGEIICMECYSREHEEARHNEIYTLCESCRRNCYTGGVKYPDGYTCEDCEEDEEDDE